MVFKAVVVAFGLALTSPGFAYAAGVQIPEAIGYVNDFADFISEETEGDLEEILSAFAQETGVEMVVAVTPTMQDTYIEDLAEQWFQTWSIGKEQEDNGALLLLVADAREMRLEVGYGLEPLITDAIAKRILDTHVRPALQAGGNDAGVRAGAEAVMRVMREGNAQEYAQEAEVQEKEGSPWVPGAAFAFFLLLFFVLHKKGMTRHGRGGMGGFGGGSSGGGGGFGGFGGGSSGGGGASSKW